MYDVSQKYENAISQTYRVCAIKGTITTTAGDVLEVTDKIISSGSLYINNQCVNSSDFEYGAVFSGELGISVRTTFDRYRFYNAKIELSYLLRVNESEYEEVPLGVFFAENVERTGNFVNITAYDAMSLFDEDIKEDTSGTLYELLAYIAGRCGVELAQTEEEIRLLPNGTNAYTLQVDMVGTFRDAVAYLATMSASFAVIDRNGRLELRLFEKSGKPIIQRKNRNSTTISDFITFYDTATAQFPEDGDYKPYIISRLSPENGLTLDLGDVPIVQGTDEYKQNTLNTIFDNLQLIEYVPFEITYTGNPAIDLGDTVLLKDVDGKEDIESIVTHFEWRYRGKSTLKAVGGNPKMKRKDATSKQLASLEASISTKNIIVRSYTNASRITLGSAEKEIISINYSSVENTHPIFLATIPFVMDLDGYVVFRYYLDGVLMADDTVREYASRGEHFVTLSNNMTISKDSRRTLKVRACTEYFESDNRQHKAKILSFEDYIKTGTYVEQPPDTTIPSATIAQGGIKAVLYAQGLSAAVVWDGTLTLTDEVGEFSIGEEITTVNPTGSVVVGIKPPGLTVLYDRVPLVDISNDIITEAFSAAVTMDFGE